MQIPTQSRNVLSYIIHSTYFTTVQYFYLCPFLPTSLPPFQPHPFEISFPLRPVCLPLRPQLVFIHFRPISLIHTFTLPLSTQHHLTYLTTLSFLILIPLTSLPSPPYLPTTHTSVAYCRHRGRLHFLTLPLLALIHPC